MKKQIKQIINNIKNKFKQVYEKDNIQKYVNLIEIIAKIFFFTSLSIYLTFYVDLIKYFAIESLLLKINIFFTSLLTHVSNPYYFNLISFFHKYFSLGILNLIFFLIFLLKYTGFILSFLIMVDTIWFILLVQINIIEYVENLFPKIIYCTKEKHLKKHKNELRKLKKIASKVNYWHTDIMVVWSYWWKKFFFFKYIFTFLFFLKTHFNYKIIIFICEFLENIIKHSLYSSLVALNLGFLWFKYICFYQNIIAFISIFIYALLVFFFELLNNLIDGIINTPFRTYFYNDDFEKQVNDVFDNCVYLTLRKLVYVSIKIIFIEIIHFFFKTIETFILIWYLYSYWLISKFILGFLYALSIFGAINLSIKEKIIFLYNWIKICFKLAFLYLYIYLFFYVIYTFLTKVIWELMQFFYLFFFKSEGMSKNFENYKFSIHFYIGVLIYLIYKIILKIKNWIIFLRHFYYEFINIKMQWEQSLPFPWNIHLVLINRDKIKRIEFFHILL